MVICKPLADILSKILLSFSQVFRYRRLCYYHKMNVNICKEVCVGWYYHVPLHALFPYAAAFAFVKTLSDSCNCSPGCAMSGVL
jgi:hypothetical protein